MKQCIVFFILLFSFSTNCEAQILKKLKKKIKGISSSEETASTNESEKSENPTSLFGLGSAADLQKNYSFNWLYSFEMIDHKERVSNINYYFNTNARYLGFEVPQDEKTVLGFSVMDFKKELLAVFTNQDGQNTVIVTSLKVDDALEIAEDNEMINDMHGEITNLPNKRILGYNCEGFQVEDEDGITKIYVSKEPGVDYFGIFKDSNFLPRNINEEWVKQVSEGIMMEVEFIPKKRRKDYIKLVCTAIEPHEKIIQTGDYKDALAF